MEMEQEEPNAEPPNRMDEDDGPENAAAATAVVPHIEQSSEMFKLNIDCFDETFDYLPLEDLTSVGGACKRLHQVAGYCFRMNYSDIEITSRQKDIVAFGMKVLRYINVTNFIEFFGKIRIDTHPGLQFLLKFQSKLLRVNQIKVHRMNLGELDIARMSGILDKIEILDILGSQHNLHLIAHCPKLRRLKIYDCTTDFDWHTLKCSTLETFEFRPYSYTNIERMVTFVQQNPNIRKVATTAYFLWVNRNLLRGESGIRLNELAILIDEKKTEDVFESFCRLLNDLHARQVYQRLQLYIWTEVSVCQEMINQLATVNGLVKLYNIGTMDPGTSLAILNNLEELYLKSSACVWNAENVVKNLTKLRRIDFHCGNTNLMPFIRFLAPLERIKLDYIYKSMHFNAETSIIDLVALNKERKKLPFARKITLYVNETYYLATKWALKETNFEFIRLKRVESFEWGHHFEY